MKNWLKQTPKELLYLFITKIKILNEANNYNIDSKRIFSKDFSNLFKEFQEFISLYKKIKYSFTEPISIINSLNKLSLQIIKDYETFEKFYEAYKDKNVFVQKIHIKKCKRLLLKLNNSVDLLNVFIKESSKNLLEYQEINSAQLIEKYPYLMLPNTIQEENVKNMVVSMLNTPEFKYLDEELFKPIYISLNKQINFRELKITLEKLKHKGLFKEFNNNLIYFKKVFNNRFYLNDISTFTFFDNDYFEIIKRIAIIAHYGILKPEFTMFKKDIYYVNFIYDVLIKKYNGANERKAILSFLKKMISSKIKVSFYLKGGFGSVWRLAISFQEELLDILILLNIRTIHSAFEAAYLVDVIGEKLKKLQIKNLRVITKLMKNTVDSDNIDVFHLNLFLEIIELIGLKGYEKIYSQLKSKMRYFNSAMLMSIKKIVSKENNINKILSSLLDLSNLPRKTILITGPEDDHNDAFAGITKEALELPIDKFDVYTQRINHPNQLALAIKKASSKHKIDILIIGGHGEFNRIVLSDFDSKRRISEDTINTNLFNDISTHFKSSTICYLISCSTGKEDDGIAQNIADKFRIPVIAPVVDGGAKIIQNKDEIMCEYTVQTRTFKPKLLA